MRGGSRPGTVEDDDKVGRHSTVSSRMRVTSMSSLAMGLLASASDDRTVRLWNLTTGQQVQKFDNAGYIETLGLTEDNKAILTNQRAIQIDSRSALVPARESFTNMTIMIRDGWIRRGSHDLLWLPQEYRSGRSVFCGNSFAFGLHSGQVTFIELKSSS
jgi:WD40 repeat protein